MAKEKQVHVQRVKNSSKVCSSAVAASGNGGSRRGLGASFAVMALLISSLMIGSAGVVQAQDEDITGGWYRLKTMFRGDGECLEGNDAGSPVHSGAAFMDTCQNVSGQLWRFVPASDGYYRLKTMFRGDSECLEGNQVGSPVHDGSAFMDTCQNVSGQLWELVSQGNGWYRLKTMFRGDGECLEGNDASSPVHGGNAFMDSCRFAGPKEGRPR